MTSHSLQPSNPSRSLVALAATALLSLGTAPAQNATAVAGFGDGGFGAGWQSDDTRNSSGTNLVNDDTHAPVSGATNNATAVDEQINWQNFYGARGNLGGVSLTGTSSGNGKSSLSVMDASSGLAASGTALGGGFNATYRWLNTDTQAAGVSFKIGIQSTAFGSTQGNYTQTRSGESSWDLILVYDPAENGVTSNSTTIYTSSITSSSGRFALFGQAGHGAYWTANTSASGGVAPPGGGIYKTLAEWAVDPTWGTLLFGSGAKISNTQFGIGSGNANTSATVDWASVSYLNEGDAIDFVDASKWTGSNSSEFGDEANWRPNGAETGPTSTNNVVFDTGASLTANVSASTTARSVGVVNGEVTIGVANGQSLALANDGFLSAESGASLTLTGGGTTTAATLEAWGTVNVSSRVDLSGGVNPNPPRDGTSTTSRYGLVVGPNGVANLQSGANVTISQAGKNVGVRIGEGIGNAVMNIESGAALTIGGATERGFLHVGDFFSDGTLNQTGGDVQIYGAANVGQQGGDGSYNISAGNLTVGGGAITGGANVFAVGRTTDSVSRPTTGIFNVSGTADVSFVEGSAPTFFLIGGTDAANTSGSVGIVNQTGGTVRIGEGVTWGYGYGNGTYHLNGGVLEIHGGSGFSNFNPSGSAFNFGGGELQVTGSDLSINLRANLLASTTSTVDTNGSNATFTSMQGSGNLSKVGFGNLAFGAGSQIGGLDLAQGTASLSGGSMTIGTFELAADTSFDGTGNLQVTNLSGGGAITVATTISGSHNVGFSPGSQDFNEVEYLGSAVVGWELVDNTEAGRGTSFDAINVSGALTIESGATINLVFNASGSTVDFEDAFWDLDRQWVFYDVGGTTIGDFALGSVSLDSQGNTLLAAGREFASFSISKINNDVLVLYTVPEPTTLVFVGLGAALLFSRRRRHV